MLRFLLIKKTNLIEFFLSPAITMLIFMLLFYLYLQGKLTLGDPPALVNEVNDQVEQIHYSSLVVDTHSDTLTKILDANWLPLIDLGKNTPFAVDIPKLQAGGIHVQFFAACVPERYFPGQTVSRTLALLNGLYYTLDKNPYTIGLARSMTNIEHLVGDGKIAAVAAIEGADSLKKPAGLALLSQYYDLGVRVIGFTWDDSNQLAAGYRDTYYNNTLKNKGLTPFGREMLTELNRLGILVDVSHLPQSSFWDVLKFSTSPVIASHSGVFSLRQHFRNLTDDQILAIAEKGGVVQILFHSPFLTSPGTPVSVVTVVDHIDYVVSLTGTDHVGLGSDFDGGIMPDGLHDASMYPQLTAELLKRGYNQTEIEKILGGNTIRLLSQVWREAKPAEGDNEAYLDIFSLNPAYMGQVMEQPYPLKLAARITKKSIVQKIAKTSFQIIIDGNAYPYHYEDTTGSLSALISKPLGKGFHVVSFKAMLNEGQRIVSKSLIFHTPK